MLGAPIHRFVRNPNYSSTIWNRAMNRLPINESTVASLEDPKTGRKLTLIGTTNSSTLLAERTKKLIAEIKPDTVYVQTNEPWWKIVSNFKGIKTQSELNEYNSILTQAYKFKSDNTYRALAFKIRFYPWIFLANAFKRFPNDFHPFIPGLEMKYAIEEAHRLRAKIVFGGLELNDESILALINEKRMSPIAFFWRYTRSLHNKHWRTEHQDQYRMLETHGGEAYAENIDRYTINWWTKLFQKYAPRQKKILVDLRDESIFHDLWKAPGKNIVAVINQWHLEGVEFHWKHTTGTEGKNPLINPIGDFDIDEYMQAENINYALREIVCTLGRTEPASWQNYLTHYHKENFEPERSRHIQFFSYDDHDMDHKVHGLQDLIKTEFPPEILKRSWETFPEEQPKSYDPGFGHADEEMSPNTIEATQKLAQKSNQPKDAKTSEEVHRKDKTTKKE